MTSSTTGQDHVDADAIVAAPGSPQIPAPRPGDPPAHCNQCGAPMRFNPDYLADCGTWTCTCAVGWAQQKRQLKWFAFMIFVFLMIAGLAV